MMPFRWIESRMGDMEIPPFHLAFPVNDLARARAFYGELLGCREGRSSSSWVDFEFFGHQIVAHLDPQASHRVHRNAVDGHGVPVPHFGVVLSWEKFQELAKRLAEKEIRFEIGPYVRFEGQVGEQATMFFFDPFGNAIEFKAFRDPSRLFAK